MCHYGLNKVPTLPDSTLATLAVWTHKKHFGFNPVRFHRIFI